MKFSMTLIAVSFFVIASAMAGPGTQHLGPYPSTSPDNGSCGAVWANDSFDRNFTIISNGGNNFTVKEEFKKGSFVTTGPVSPGACETTPHHGSTLIAGITGSFQGSIDFNVNSTTYNPTGCNASPTTCSTFAGFLAAVFPGGTATVTSFNFEYSSSDKSLGYHHWQDKSDQAVNDKFEGDIANQ